MKNNTENLAVLDATRDMDFTMQEQRASVRIVRRAAGRVQRAKGHFTGRTEENERETFGAEYTDATHVGRYNGASFGTLAEIVAHCDAKGFNVTNVLRSKQGARTVARLWTVGDFKIAA